MLAMSHGRALLLDSPANQISQQPWQPGVYLDPFDLERDPAVLQRAQSAMSASVDLGLTTRTLLCEPGGLPREAAEHDSVYVYVSSPETTLGFYPLLANPSVEARWGGNLTAKIGLHWDHFARRALFPLGKDLARQVNALRRPLFRRGRWVIGIHVLTLTLTLIG